MTPIKSPSGPAWMFGVGAALLLGAGVAQAQIGSGWTQYYPSKQYNGGVSQSQRYSISGNVEHFWVYSTDPSAFPGHDSGPRSEWRVENNYTTGSQQFQGDLNPESGTTSYTCFQIFGSTSQATSIMLQMRSGNGTLRRYNSEVLATGCWGIYTRVNVIHYATTGTGSIEVWINGSKVGTFADGGNITHYFKYGVYDIVSSAPNYNGDYWRGVSFFSGGNSSGGSLPSGWTDADVGSVGLAGSASYSSGTFTLSGSGSDIWNTADEFNYAYQSVSGDQTVIARVVSESGSAPYAKAGVMIRESTADDAVEASVLLTPTNGVALEIRPNTGASSINVAGWIHNVTPAEWVKLVRSGNNFTGYYSSDGSSWTQIASTNVTMNSSATAGLAVTSHDNSSWNMVAFDNVSISAGGGIDTTAEYQLQNEASGLVLNNQGSLTNGSAITQWSSVNSDNLRWTFIPTDSGYYQINSVKSGLDAVVQGASTSQGAGIIQWSFGSAQNDQWEPVQNSDGSYTFYNRHSGMVMDDPGGSTSNTTQMIQWGANGGDNQKWQLIKQ